VRDMEVVSWVVAASTKTGGGGWGGLSGVAQALSIVAPAQPRNT
jgi:hypothetical protein